ncbi:hypothetical protein F5X97DRAFT_299375 [Nemania serpens]|nr:hypothetical protein F5X97DRAFT_299375 [Nemania serpens]
MSPSIFSRGGVFLNLPFFIIFTFPFNHHVLRLYGNPALPSISRCWFILHTYVSFQTTSSSPWISLLMGLVVFSSSFSPIIRSPKHYRARHCTGPRDGSRFPESGVAKVEIT